jgi:hypothetical protein
MAPTPVRVGVPPKGVAPLFRACAGVGPRSQAIIQIVETHMSEIREVKELRRSVNAPETTEIRELTAEEISFVAGSAFITSVFSEVIKSLGEALSDAARKQ